MTDLRQSKSYAKYLKSQGWTIERKNGVNYFLKKVPILGYILKVQRPKKLFINSISEAWPPSVVNQLINKYKPYLISIEPNDNKQIDLLIANDYRLTTNAFLPTKTLRIDLTKSVKQITADFDKRLMSKIIRGSKVKTKIYTTTNEIKIFQKAWKNSVNLSRNVLNVDQLLSIKNSYQQNDSLLLASHNINSRVIGGALFTICREIDDIVCYYWYGFTNKEGRALLSQFSLMYQAILWAKNRGCKVFDFEGIYDDRFPKKDWLGFTRFKKEFGGYEISYPGCYVKYNLLNVIANEVKQSQALSRLLRLFTPRNNTRN